MLLLYPQNCRLETKMAFESGEGGTEEKRTMAARLLSDYAGFAPALNFEAFTT